MTTLSSFRKFTDSLQEQYQPMPVLFIGHGSPMNGIEDNEENRHRLILFLQAISKFSE